MEEKWVVYDDEETEVQLELADLIFDKLVSETTDLIASIYEKRHGVPIMEKKQEFTEDLVLPKGSEKSSAKSTPRLERKSSL